jgi:hypothetical protein
MGCDDKTASDPAPEDNEELVDYSSSPEHINLDINVIHMSMDGYMLSKENVTHLTFGPTSVWRLWKKLRKTRGEWLEHTTRR